MPQVWKLTRYQPNIFHENGSWHRSLRSALAVLWLLVMSAVALWFLAGGPEARSAANGIVRWISYLVELLRTAVQRFFQP